MIDETNCIEIAETEKQKLIIIDYVNNQCEHEYKCTLDTDCWSSYVCKKCENSKIVDFT